ncbi:hypothetical protein C2G38_2048791 [Gigaspora rosea]|uniref:Uncharacterized protein n=1 Tax=Gigaspora rosea TaxID=44941 RepID=A0A397UA79_9GLOM|nr:hypothetical protein C2G38_2048791 [Gigaspora rosea]
MTEGYQNLRKSPRSVMQESVQSTSKVILNNRSQILHWNEYTLEESKKWWLPEKSNCVALNPNLWSGSLKKMGHGTWYSIQIFVPTITKLENLQTVFVVRHNGLCSADVSEWKSSTKTKACYQKLFTAISSDPNDTYLPIAKEEKRPPE